MVKEYLFFKDINLTAAKNGLFILTDKKILVDLKILLDNETILFDEKETVVLKILDMICDKDVVSVTCCFQTKSLASLDETVSISSSFNHHKAVDIKDENLIYTVLELKEFSYIKKNEDDVVSNSIKLHSFTEEPDYTVAVVD